MQSLDALVLAVAQSAQLSLARLTMLAEPAYTGLHPFLGDGTPAASGVMIVEYSAASALAELRALATPAGLQVVTLSRGVEEDASFATLAARQALEAARGSARCSQPSWSRRCAACGCRGCVRAPCEPALDHLDARDGGIADMHDRDLTSDLLLAEELVDACLTTPWRCSALLVALAHLDAAGTPLPWLRSERSERLETTRRNRNEPQPAALSLRRI